MGGRMGDIVEMAVLGWLVGVRACIAVKTFTQDGTRVPHPCGGVRARRGWSARRAGIYSRTPAEIFTQDGGPCGSPSSLGRRGSGLQSPRAWFL